MFGNVLATFHCIHQTSEFISFTKVCYLSLLGLFSESFGCAKFRLSSSILIPKANRLHCALVGARLVSLDLGSDDNIDHGFVRSISFKLMYFMMKGYIQGFVQRNVAREINMVPHIMSRNVPSDCRQKIKRPYKLSGETYNNFPRTFI